MTAALSVTCQAPAAHVLGTGDSPRTLRPEDCAAQRARVLDAAYSYIEGSPQLPIFPVDPVTKRPLIKTGVDHAANASTDPATIERWILHRFRGCSIAAPTGEASGIVVIDVDRKHDGEQLLAALERALGPLPRVRVVRTRSGGLHIYLAHPGLGIRVRTGAGSRSPLGRLLGGRDGVDVRADGGIVVLPPSLGYRWLADDDEAFPPVPPMWLAAIQGAGEPAPPPRRPAPITSDIVADMVTKMRPIAQGGRNGTLFAIGVRLRHAAWSDSQILAGLEQINAALVSPPLPDRELRKIACSAARSSR